MAEKSNVKKNEIAVVSKRVENTKKEICNLEAELQKLISTGINNTNKHVTRVAPNTSDKENLVYNNIEHKTDPQSRITLNNFSEAEQNIETKLSITNRRALHRQVPLIAITRSNAPSSKTKINQVDPKENTKRSKNSDFDREKAREYIRKQKEKRLEEAKALNQAQNTIEAKKQKLKELHQKSLQILTKNVELKRKRSRSRETKEHTDKIAHNTKQEDLKAALTNIPHLSVVKDVESNGNNATRVKQSQKNSDCSKSSLDEIKILNHPQRSNITIRKKSPRPGELSSREHASTDFFNNVSAVPVKNTKSPQGINKNEETITTKHKQAATTIQAFYRGYCQRKLYRKMIEKRKLLQQTKSKFQKHADLETDYHSVNKNQEALQLLLPHIPTASHPYNFINSVRRKLNLAVGSYTPTAKANVAVQSSFADSICRTPTQEIFEKTKNDIKLVLEKSSKSSHLKSVISPKTLDNKLKEAQLHHSHSSRISKKVSRQLDEPSKKQQDSDSDTSRNIPNISSESSARCDTNADKLIPEDTHENFSNDKNPSDSELPEYKLEINSEALMNLKLRRTRLRSFENTVVFMNNDTSKSEVPCSKEQDNLKVNSKSSSHSVVNTNSQVCSNSREEVKCATSYSHSNESSPESLGSFSKSDIISSNTSDYNTKKLHASLTPENKLNGMKETDEVDNIVAINDTTSVTHLVAFQERMMENIKSASNQIVQNLQAVEDTENVSVESITESDVMETDVQNSVSDAYSSSFTAVDSANLPLLKHPSLVLESPRNLPKSTYNNIVKESTHREINISLRNGDGITQESKGNSNQIHLKIEAELHLLNDFNESLRKYVELEKSVLELKNYNKHKENTLLKHCDTQTSLASQNSRNKNPSASSKTSSRSNREITNINYSRGSDITENISAATSFDCDSEKELAVTGFELSSLQNVSDSSVDQSNLEQSMFINENFKTVPYIGLSLGMFDQLIKEEDTRIENLKTILKIREKSLLDRTKTEIAWLEIQKKHLKETGQLHEVSQLKKKQRGILMRLQHEYHEMQTLKQMQKAASKERKAVLKQRRNMIKSQLSTNNMLTKVKLNTPRDSQRNSGPFKVYNIQSHTESIRSETSISRNSAGEEVVSVTSHSIINRVSDLEVNEKDPDTKTSRSLAKADKIQRSLLMRETALLKRRKAAEELLQWHQKLTEEEKKVAELEMVANSIINEVSKTSTTPEERISGEHTFQGTQLNLLWQNMTGREDKKFNDHETYPLTPIALKRLCKDAKKNASKNNLEKNNKFNDKNRGYGSVNSDLDYCSDTTSAIKTDIESDKNNRTESVKSQVENNNEQNFENLGSFKKDSEVTEMSLCKNISDNYSYNFDQPISLNNKEVSNSEATLAKSGKNSDRISSISELIDNLTKTNEESYLSSNKSMVNKSIDTETEKNETLNYKSKDSDICSSSEDMKLCNSYNNKIEVNKPLLLRESLSAENSRALLDNIESLKSSIQKITSKSESRIRSSRHLQKTSEELSKLLNVSNSGTTENDIPDLTKNDTASTDSQIIVTNELEKKCNIDFEKDNLKVREDASSCCSLLDTSQDNLEEKLPSEDVVTNIIKVSENCTDISENLELIVTEDKNLVKTYSDETDTINLKSTSIAPEIDDEENGSRGDISSQSCNSESLSKTVTSDEQLFIENVDDKSDQHVEEEYNNQTLTEKSEVVEDIDNSIEMPFNQLPEIIEKDVNTTGLQDVTSVSKIDSSSWEEVSQIEQTTEKISEVLPNESSKSSIPETEEELKQHIEDEPQKDIEESPSVVSNTPPDLSYGIILPQNLDQEATQPDVINLENTDVEDDVHSENKSEIAKCEASLELLFKLPEGKLKEAEESENENTFSEGLVELSEPKSEQLEKIQAQKCKVDIKKRVLEILADANSPRGDKSPRLQDLYVTTYDVASPGSSPELRSPSDSLEKEVTVPLKKLYGNEAEELLKKQLAIEQEIKQLEQQQKEQIPFLFVREIPNKPPPPYKPPVSTPTLLVPSVLPASSDQVSTITHHIANILYNAHVQDKLDSASFNDKQCHIFDDTVDFSCVKFLFDICKELATEHYGLFRTEQGPSWMHLTKKAKLCVNSPLDKNELEIYLNKKVKELFAFEKVERRENAIIKWSRKKRDHVDEILVLECQDEEAEWTNYDKDELYVKNEVTNEIMNMLLSDTAEVLSKIFKKRTGSC